jgi:hypothetical protein
VSDELPPLEPPAQQGSKPPFDRERFVFKTLAAGVCGQPALAGRPVGQVCPGTIDKLQMGFDSTFNLLLALLGGAALTRVGRPPDS